MPSFQKGSTSSRSIAKRVQVPVRRGPAAPASRPPSQGRGSCSDPLPDVIQSYPPHLGHSCEPINTPSSSPSEERNHVTPWSPGPLQLQLLTRLPRRTVPLTTARPTASAPAPRPQALPASAFNRPLYSRCGQTLLLPRLHPVYSHSGQKAPKFTYLAPTAS